MPGVWLKIYQIGWLLGCTLSSVVYFALSFVRDPTALERGMTFEEQADLMYVDGVDGVDDVESAPAVVYTGKE